MEIQIVVDPKLDTTSEDLIQKWNSDSETSKLGRLELSAPSSYEPSTIVLTLVLAFAGGAAAKAGEHTMDIAIKKLKGFFKTKTTIETTKDNSQIIVSSEIEDTKN